MLGLSLFLVCNVYSSFERFSAAYIVLLDCTCRIMHSTALVVCGWVAPSTFWFTFIMFLPI